MTAAAKYDAFISYSHSDTELADRVRHEMQTIGKPLWRRRMHRIYLDQASLGLDGDEHGLKGSLLKAIDSSVHMIALLSPTAADSEWANAELTHFVATRGTDSLLLAVADGELRWNAADHKFTADSTACPPAIRDAYENEPKFVDLRWFADPDFTGDRDARLRSDVAELLTQIRGQDKDEIVGGDLRSHRRNMLLISVAAALLLALASVALLLRFQSEANRLSAESEALAATAISTSQDDLDQAVLLAAASGEVKHTEGADRGLFSALAAGFGVDRMTRDTGSSFRSLAVSSDGATIVTGDINGRVEVRSSPDLEVTKRLDTRAGDIREIILSSRSSTTAFAAGADGSVLVLDLDRGAVVKRIPVAKTPIYAIAQSLDGRNLYAGADDAAVHVIDVASTTVTGTIGPHFYQVRGLDVFDDGQSIAIAGRRNETRTEDPVAVVSLVDGRELAVARDPSDGSQSSCERDCLSSISTVTHHPHNAAGLILGSLSGALLWWEPATGNEPTIIGKHTDQVARVRVGGSSDRPWLASTGFDHSIKYWDANTMEQLGPSREHHGAQVWDSAQFGDNVITVSEAGTIAIESPFDWTSPLGKVVVARHEAQDLTEVEVATIDGKDVVVIARHNDLVLSPANTDERELESDAATYTALAVHPHEPLIYAGIADGEVVAWDLTAGKVVASFTADITPYGAAVSPDGRHLAIVGPRHDATSAEAHFFSLGDEPERSAVLPDLNQFTARTIAFSPRGDLVVVSGVSPARALYKWPSLEAVAGSADVTYTGVGVSVNEAIAVIGSERQTVDVIQRRDGSRMVLNGARSTVRTTAIRASQPIVAAAGGDGLVRLYEVGDRTDQFGPALVGHTDTVIDMAFSSDGSRLYSLSRRELIEWNLNEAEWRTIACDFARRNLTQAEWLSNVGSNLSYTESCPDR